MKQSLKKLKKIWSDKLKASGFNDIETSRGYLKNFTISKSRVVNYQYGIATSRDEYYRLAQTFLNEYNFETELERIVWEYHANGISYRDIGKLLEQTKVVKWNNRTSVYNIIKPLKKKMLDKYLLK